jgi:hypothetical protein
VSGIRRMRKRVVGTIREFPTNAAAQAAVQGLRFDINNHSCGQRERPQTVRLLVDHYRLKELPMTSSERKTRLTQRVYWTNLKRHILPRWVTISFAGYRVLRWRIG